MKSFEVAGHFYFGLTVAAHVLQIMDVCAKVKTVFYIVVMTLQLQLPLIP